MKKLFLLLSIFMATRTLWSIPVTQQDSLALVAIYNSCGGSAWSDNTNWLTTPVSEWPGVTVTGDRVTGLDLSDNGLSGTIPVDIRNLTSLTSLEMYWNDLTGEIPSDIGLLVNLSTLDLDYNQLTGEIPTGIGNLANLSILYLDHNKLTGEIPAGIGNLTNLTILCLGVNQLTGPIPDLSGLTSLERLHLKDNSFVFADLAASGIGASDIPTFEYFPQGKLALESVEAGGNYTLSAPEGHAGNQYQWFKNGQEMPGETSRQLTVLSGEETEYYCQVNNSLYPYLTLKTETAWQLPVSQQDSLALVAIYNSCGGDSWYNNTNWLNGPVCEWYGVTTGGGQVTGLNLTWNNLSGTIPSEI